MALPVRRTTSVSPQPMQRWEPFRELERLQEHMDNLMQTAWSPTGTANGGIWMPVTDIEETEDAWIVEAELPGVDRKDVNVELRDSELIISGEIKEKERNGILRRQTRRTGEFEYRVTLPGQSDAEHIEASLHDGVLTVRVPKSEQTRPRRIEVKAE
ncbi:MAG TPA: Hsp20/alpha crystallin family protein [Solirubrobacteraceae bacterium]